MHCLSNFTLPSRNQVWIFTKKIVKDSLPNQWYISKTFECLHRESKSTFTMGLHRAQLIWLHSGAILGRCKPTQLEQQAQEGSLILRTEKPFPTRKSRALFCPHLPLNLGAMIRFLGFPPGVCKAGNIRDHWSFCFLLVVEGAIRVGLRWGWGEFGQPNCRRGAVWVTAVTAKGRVGERSKDQRIQSQEMLPFWMGTLASPLKRLSQTSPLGLNTMPCP